MNPGEDLRTVRLSAITQDPRFQIRKKLDQRTIKSYAASYKNGEELPPLKVAELDGAVVLLSGWHRLEALNRIGAIEAEAEVVPVSGPSEALWVAAKDNLRHGLPLKAAEVREVFRAFVRAGKHRRRGGYLSYRELASAAVAGSKSYSTMRRWMATDFPKVYEAMGNEEAAWDTGGYRPGAVPGLEAVVAESLRNAVAAFQGVPKGQRPRLLEFARESLRAMEEGGEVKAFRGPLEEWDPGDPTDLDGEF